MKKLLCIVACLFLLMQPAMAQSDVYYIYNQVEGGKQVKSFLSKDDALNFYKNNLDKYENLVLYQNDKILLMEYGVVSFKTNDACDLLIDIKSDTSRKINGCYANDAAYISSSEDLNRVKIMISDFVGYVNFDDVTLVPLSSIANRPSMYYVKDDILYHSLKTQYKIDYYTKNYALSNTSLKDGAYYSYDGHYFYDNFYKMIDDYRMNIRDNAVNFNNPYFNYYMYLPFRTYSSYDVNDFEDYFYNDLMIDGRLLEYKDDNQDGANDVVTKSELYDTFDEFVTYQYLYGSNALLNIATSIHESAYGKTLEAYEKNNLFGMYAFNGEFERNNMKYREVESSIYAHTRFVMSRKFLNDKMDEYHGGFLGNFKSGINVAYSDDPYWGEKVAAEAYRMDSNMGLFDYRNNRIGIILNDFTIYSDENLNSSLKYITEKPFALSIVGENEKAYQVLIDNGNREDDSYDIENSYGYIDKNVVAYKYGKKQENKYKIVEYNPDGGKYYGGDSLTIKMPINHKIPQLTPNKDGYLFKDYQQEVDGNHYLMNAEYRQINSIKLNKADNQVIFYGENIDLSKYSLNIRFEDGESVRIPVVNEMIDDYDKYKSGEQEVKVNFAGFEDSFKITVSADLSAENNELINQLNQIFDEYDNNRQFNINELMHVLSEFRKHNLEIDKATLAKLDKMMMYHYGDKIALCIDNNDIDASVTGLGFLAGSMEYYDFKLGIYDNAYRMSIKPVRIKNLDKIKNITKNYDFELDKSFKLVFFKNYDEIDLSFPFTVQIKLDNIDSTRLHTVYRLDENGDVYKCKTKQSANYISFSSDKAGEFYVLSMDTNNDYQFNDKYEVLNQNNSDFFAQKATIDTLIPVSIVIADEILIMIYMKLRERNKRIWKDYRKSLHSVASHQEEKPKN